MIVRRRWIGSLWVLFFVLAPAKTLLTIPRLVKCYIIEPHDGMPSGLRCSYTPSIARSATPHQMPICRISTGGVISVSTHLTQFRIGSIRLAVEKIDRAAGPKGLSKTNCYKRYDRIVLMLLRTCAHGLCKLMYRSIICIISQCTAAVIMALRHSCLPGDSIQSITIQSSNSF